MVDKVDDNHNEVLRGAAELSDDLSKYDLRTKIKNSASDPVKTALFDVETGLPFFVSPAGGLEVAELIRLVGDNFESGVFLPNIWQSSITGSGTGSAILGQAVLATGTTADSTSQFQTVNRARFVTATFNKAHMAMQMPPIANFRGSRS